MTIRVTMKGTGQVVNFPDDTDPNVMREALARLSQQQAAQMQEQPPQQEPGFLEQAGQLAQRAGQAIVDEPTGIGAVATELAASINKGAIDLVDFLGPNSINSILRLGGSDLRVPKLAETKAGKKATARDFIDEGLGRDIVQTVGELIGPGAAVGGALRGVAKGIPQLASGEESIVTGILRQIGKTTPAADVSAAALSGVGAEVGEEVGGVPGKLIGSLAAPLAPAAIGAAAKRLVPGRAQAQAMTPEQIQESEQTIAAGKEFGIRVMTQDVLPPKTILGKLAQQFSERIPFIGTGGPRAAQQAERINAANALDAEVPQIDDVAIAASLRDNVSNIKNLAGKRIQRFEDDLTPRGEVPVIKTTESIDRGIQQLTRAGKLRDAPLIQHFEEMRTAIQGISNFKALRTLRTDFRRKVVEKVDAAGTRLMSSDDQVLADNIERGMTRDLDAFVKQFNSPREFKKYKQGDKIYQREAKILQGTRLRNAFNKGETRPELTTKILRSIDKSERVELFNKLDTEGRQNSRLALYRTALDGATRRGEVNPQRLNTQFDKLRKQMSTFFRGDDLRELEGLRRVLTATERAQAFGAVTPTGQSLQFPAGVALGAGALAGSPKAMLTIVGAGTLGVANRAFNSQLMRDHLIRVAKAPKGGKLEKALIENAAIKLQSAALTLQDVQTEEQQNQQLQ